MTDSYDFGQVFSELSKLNESLDDIADQEISKHAYTDEDKRKAKQRHLNYVADKEIANNSPVSNKQYTAEERRKAQQRQFNDLADKEIANTQDSNKKASTGIEEAYSPADMKYAVEVANQQLERSAENIGYYSLDADTLVDKIEYRMSDADPAARSKTEVALSILKAAAADKNSLISQDTGKSIVSILNAHGIDDRNMDVIYGEACRIQEVVLQGNQIKFVTTLGDDEIIDFADDYLS